MGSLTEEEIRKKFRNTAFDRTIVSYIDNRMLASERSMSANITEWLANESQYNAEILTTPEDLDRKKSAGDEPIYIPLRIPYTYAAVQTYLTYLLALFTKRRPMFQLLDANPEKSDVAEQMEMVLHNNALNRGFLISIHTWLRDGLIYNRGIIWRDWFKQVSRNLRSKQQVINGTPVGDPIKEVVERIEDEGNDLFTSSPFDSYFDPGVTMQQYQDGEFVARVYYQTWTKILENIQKGKYWDVRDRIPLSSAIQWKNRTNTQRPGDEEAKISTNRRNSIEIVDMIIRLVPHEWQLGSSMFPEYWRIQVANGATVLMAKPLMGMYEYPCYVIEPEFDGRTLHTKGFVSMMQPLQELLSWLINSHMDSVRKTINNKLIIDPSLVNWDDVVHNRPYIRLAKRGYGRQPSQVIHQLQVSDVTQTHLRDINLVTELLTRISAATENFMGLVNQGGRKTATEVRTANTLAGSRIEKTALVIGHQGWIPLTRGLVNGIQDNLSITMYYRDFLDSDPTKQIKIPPEAIKEGHFRFPAVDPTIPVDRFAIAQTWSELIGIVGQNQGLAQSYDIGKMLNEWAELGGIKNLDNFKVAPQITQGVPNGTGTTVQPNFGAQTAGKP